MDTSLAMWAATCNISFAALKHPGFKSFINTAGLDTYVPPGPSTVVARLAETSTLIKVQEDAAMALFDQRGEGNNLSLMADGLTRKNLDVIASVIVYPAGEAYMADVVDGLDARKDASFMFNAMYRVIAGIMAKVGSPMVRWIITDGAAVMVVRFLFFFCLFGLVS